MGSRGYLSLSKDSLVKYRQQSEVYRAWKWKNGYEMLVVCVATNSHIIKSRVPSCFRSRRKWKLQPTPWWQALCCFRISSGPQSRPMNQPSIELLEGHPEEWRILVAIYYWLVEGGSDWLIINFWCSQHSKANRNEVISALEGLGGWKHVKVPGMN